MMDETDKIMAVMAVSFDPFFGEAWNRRQVSDALLMPTTQVCVIDDGAIIGGDGQPAGFTLSRSAADEEELLLIAVRPEMRRRGLAKKLLCALSKAARSRGVAKIFLEMRADNPAEPLYKAFGFQPIGVRRDYYRTATGKKTDAVTFGKML